MSCLKPSQDTDKSAATAGSGKASLTRPLGQVKLGPAPSGSHDSADVKEACRLDAAADRRADASASSPTLAEITSAGEVAVICQVGKTSWSTLRVAAADGGAAQTQEVKVVEPLLTAP